MAQTVAMSQFAALLTIGSDDVVLVGDSGNNRVLIWRLADELVEAPA